MQYKIAASILNANFLYLKQEIDAVVDLVDELHLDVMDGTFVDNLSFGAPVLGPLRSAYPNVVMESHLMISKPHAYWGAFRDIGSSIITFHYEATHLRYILLKQFQDAGIGAGISITPGTDAALLEPLREFIDRVLIMTVEPGFGGQAFVPPMLRKIEKTRKLLGDEVDIEVDGGIKDETIRDAKNAGANVFVVGSYIFKAEDKPARVNGLRERLAD
jgi:ribulose-phosphate 3-epimerase